MTVKNETFYRHGVYLQWNKRDQMFWLWGEPSSPHCKYPFPKTYESALKIPAINVLKVKVNRHGFVVTVDRGDKKKCQKKIVVDGSSESDFNLFFPDSFLSITLHIVGMVVCLGLFGFLIGDATYGTLISHDLQGISTKVLIPDAPYHPHEILVLTTTSSPINNETHQSTHVLPSGFARGTIGLPKNLHKTSHATSTTVTMAFYTWPDYTIEARHVYRFKLDHSNTKNFCRLSFGVCQTFCDLWMYVVDDDPREAALQRVGSSYKFQFRVTPHLELDSLYVNHW
jgi:hypothetical protein